MLLILDFEEIKNYVQRLYDADILVVGDMVLENAMLTFVLIKVEFVIAYDKSG